MFRMFLILVLSLFIVIGCSTKYTEKETGNIEEANQFKTPPQLTLTVEEDSFTVAQGGYSWSYENIDGTTVFVEADSMPPGEIVSDKNPIEVDEDTEITLDFEMEPTDYKVKIWDANHNVLAVYDKINLSEYKGNVIYEVFANWEQGSSSYAFLLYIK
ncbi:hypothetical protein [Oceanobacillus polygoni]|uniref:Uncharacterized protein n=1 Tax=Oceanobacillus polygoni TaxID=1235259 RepID=A0A9X0YY85_9BACI|nr:hypothetical protein [Oceanobacillus polygoni]MBP2079941.1 hypothetical protein [Oceanobacillus polygoni]